MINPCPNCYRQGYTVCVSTKDNAGHGYIPTQQPTQTDMDLNVHVIEPPKKHLWERQLQRLENKAARGKVGPKDYERMRDLQKKLGR